MKKTYIQPETIAVSLRTEGMIATSINLYDSQFDTTTDGQLTNKKESSIWGDSQEEGKGGIW